MSMIRPPENLLWTHIIITTFLFQNHPKSVTCFAPFAIRSSRPPPVCCDTKSASTVTLRARRIATRWSIANYPCPVLRTMCRKRSATYAVKPSDRITCRSIGGYICLGLKAGSKRSATYAARPSMLIKWLSISNYTGPIHCRPAGTAPRLSWTWVDWWVTFASVALSRAMVKPKPRKSNFLNLFVDLYVSVIANDVLLGFIW